MRSITPALSGLFAAALAAADLVKACSPCAESQGLCHFHAEHDHAVMPLLREASWHRDAHRGTRYNDAGKASSPEADKIRQRKARKRERTHERFQRALAGEYTRSRKVA